MKEGEGISTEPVEVVLETTASGKPLATIETDPAEVAMRSLVKSYKTFHRIDCHIKENQWNIEIWDIETSAIENYPNQMKPSYKCVNEPMHRNVQNL